jgi:glycosyltransferase involved in cell wall biosynthesis
MQALQRLAAGDSRIHLLGFRNDVDAALQALDLFVSPSREEAFPLAVLEAMRARLPIIASATQGPLEMLAGQPATLVPVGDVAALGRALQAELAALRPVARAERRPIAYETSAYDRSEAVQGVLAFYREVLARRPPSATGPAQTQQAALHV